MADGRNSRATVLKKKRKSSTKSPWNPDGAGSSRRTSWRGSQDGGTSWASNVWLQRNGQEIEEEITDNSICGKLVRVVEGDLMERMAGLLIMLNFTVIILETDIRSSIKVGGLSADATTAAEKRLHWLEFANNCFFLVYAAECILRLGLLRSRFFSSAWNLLDSFLIAFGVASFVLEFMMDSPPTSMLRVCRMVRLLRLSRVFVGLRELRSLILGLTHCMKTLFWATGLIFLTLTVWSIVAVEYLTPLMDDIDYGSCIWCDHAFENVLTSNLTFFQIVSGDGWSTLARPIIDMHPWTAAIFVSVILVVVFGLLNLIIAAIVDTAAQAREADIECLAECASEARDEAWTVFRDLCVQLDSDGNGEIDLDELREGLKKNQKLRDYFSMMEIAEDDMVELFALLDEDKSGDLSYKEFHNQLYKMKTLAVKTQLFYVTRYVKFIQKQLHHQGTLLAKLGTASEACATPTQTGLPLKEELTQMSCSEFFREPAHRQSRGAECSSGARAAADSTCKLCIDVVTGDTMCQSSGETCCSAVGGQTIAEDCSSGVENPWLAAVPVERGQGCHGFSLDGFPTPAADCAEKPVGAFSVDAALKKSLVGTGFQRVVNDLDPGVSI